MHVSSFTRELIRVVAYLLLVMAIFIPLERLFAARAQKVFRPAFLIDLGYYLIGSVAPKLLLILPLSALAWALHRAVPGGYYAEVARLPVVVRLAGAMVVGEIGYYWAHRAMHRYPALWRMHAIHHQAEAMDWLVNTRAHPFDVFFGRFCGLVPIYVLGLGQPMGNHVDTVPMLFALIGGMWGFFVHANVNWRFGWLEAVIATPAFHHWHHTNDGAELIGKNYASTLPWLDRLFGTHHLPPALPATYGIDHEIPSDLIGQLAYPLTLGKTARGAAPVVAAHEREVMTPVQS
jgi:sterol desaturase/sphingolipid hydroxylase (fatty acid hydroxylase superfamily)